MPGTSDMSLTKALSLAAAVLAVLPAFIDGQQRQAFDLAAFQKTLETGCKCAKAFYSGSREERRLEAVEECLRQRFPNVPFNPPRVPVETECPQSAISTYARLNAYTTWRRENFSPEDAVVFDNCVWSSLGYMQPDGTANQQFFQKEITGAFFDEPSFAGDRSAFAVLQSVLGRARSPVCTEHKKPDEYIRCSLKPCFGSAAVPNF